MERSKLPKVIDFESRRKRLGGQWYDCIRSVVGRALQGRLHNQWTILSFFFNIKKLSMSSNNNSKPNKSRLLITLGPGKGRGGLKIEDGNSSVV